jgi:hypothetical protein
VPSFRASISMHSPAPCGPNAHTRPAASAHSPPASLHFSSNASQNPSGRTVGLRTTSPVAAACSASSSSPSSPTSPVLRTSDCNHRNTPTLLRTNSAMRAGSGAQRTVHATAPPPLAACIVPRDAPVVFDDAISAAVSVNRRTCVRARTGRLHGRLAERHDRL